MVSQNWSTVKVYPWVGEKYQKPDLFKFKLLILGESNFTLESKFNHNLVIDCVLDDMGNAFDRDTEGFCKFSTKIRRVVLGPDTIVSPSEFWQSAAFYNFVQYLVGEKARDRPSEEMWTASIVSFQEIVAKLLPERLLVIGKKNWCNLLSHIEHKMIDEYTAYLMVNNFTIIAAYINHPSSGGFGYKRWCPIVDKLINDDYTEIKKQTQ